MNTKKNYEHIECVVRNIARVNSVGIHDFCASFRMDDDDVTVLIGRLSTSNENDKVITSCPDAKFAEYVEYLCERWMEKMRQERQSTEAAETEEGGEA